MVFRLLMEKRKFMHLPLIMTVSFLTAFPVLLFPQDCLAGPVVLTNVKVIHASSSGRPHLDPELEHLAGELKSVFKYTSYRLLKVETMKLPFQNQGKVKLPGGGNLAATPLSGTGNRIRYLVAIEESGKLVFSTEIMLDRNRSITIGGPRHKKGYLLFNISGKVL